MVENIRFRQVADEIRKELLKPEWKVGMKLWTESELMTRFNIGRNTARNAFAKLEREGIVLRNRGTRGILQQKPADNSKARRGLSFGLINSPHKEISANSDVSWIGTSLQAELRHYEATLSIFPWLSSSEPKMLDAIRNIVDKNLVDGFFLLGTPDLEETAQYLTEKKIPYVYLIPALNHDQTVVPLDYVVAASEYDATVDYFNLHPECKNIVLFAGKSDYNMGRVKAILESIALSAARKFTCIDCRKPDFPALLNEVKKYAFEPDVCIAFSSSMISEMDCALTFLDAHPTVLTFKHYDHDTTRYQHKYPLIARDYGRFGKEAVQLMFRLVGSQSAARPVPPQQIVISSVLKQTNNIEGQQK